MRRIHVRELCSLPLIETHVFHDSGEHLASSSEGFSPEQVGLLEDAGIEIVYILDGYDNIVQFSIDQRNKFILTDELAPEHYMVGPILSPSGEILLRHGQPITEAAKTRLKRHGYYSVPVRKSHPELRLNEVREYHRLRREGRRGRSGRRQVVSPT